MSDETISGRVPGNPTIVRIRLARMQNEMGSNRNDSLATHRELDDIIDETLRNAQHVRIILLTWVRAHQNMANGTVSGAEWFDIGETTKSLIKSAPGAIL